MRPLALLLVVLIALIQAELWMGRGGLPRSVSLQGQVREQQQKNEVARQRNAQLDAEVSDLKEGLEMVEEKARLELGMVKPDEILVQVQRAAPAASSASPTSAAKP